MSMVGVVAGTGLPARAPRPVFCVLPAQHTGFSLAADVCTHIGLLEKCVGKSCVDMPLGDKGHLSWDFATFFFGVTVACVLLCAVGSTATIWIEDDRLLNTVKALGGIGSRHLSEPSL